MARDTNDKPMSIGEHLEELRKRVALALVGVVPIFAVGLWFGKDILHLMVDPLEAALRREHIAGGGMMTGQLLEGFITYIKIAAVLALVFGAPWIMFQAWKFIAPGLYSKERRFVYVLAPMSVFFSCAGIAFMYFVMLPFVLKFFVIFNEGLLTRPPSPVVDVPPGFVLPSLPALEGDPRDPKPGQYWLNTKREEIRVALPDPVAAEAAAKARASKDEVAEQKALAAPPVVLGIPLHSDSFMVQQYKLAEYVSLLLTLALAFAVAFQTPIVVLLLGWTLMDRKTLAKYRKYALLVCTLVAAAITPPDLTSMVMLLVPMYLLYEVGLILLWILPAKKVASGKFFSRDTGASDGDGGGEGGR